MKSLMLGLMLVASVTAAQDVCRVLPDSIGGLSKSGSAAIYAGNELYRLIDGGADIFLEYGFRKVMVQRYSDQGGGYIDAELYEMRDSSSAYGIFSLITFSTGRQISFPCEAYTGNRFLLLWKGNYYVSLSCSGSSTDSELVNLAKGIERGIPLSGRPKLVTIVKQMIGDDSERENIAYIRGTLALYNLTTISFGDDFKVEQGVCLETPEAQRFVFAYADEGSCREEYSQVVNYLKRGGPRNLMRSDRQAGLFMKDNRFIKVEGNGSYLLLSIRERKKVQ